MRLKYALIAGFFISLLSGVALTGLLAWWMVQPIAPYNKEATQFVVPPGSSVRAIAALLKEKGFIRSEYAFQAVVVQQKLSKRLQAGAFSLSPSQDLFSLANSLTSGTNDIKVTIKEGLRAEEIGEVLTATLTGFDTKDEAFKSECLAKEGYLFPETYFIPASYNERQICKLLVQEYGNKVTMKMRETIHAQGKSEEEIIILASIITREAKKPSDMKLVSGVLWNRLKIGMPLQVDATLQYIKGYDAQKKTWWPSALSADKELNSPYNTYKNAGLPPTPISNPGLDAIEAAISPTATGALYYISNSNGSEMYFAETYDEHMVNIDKHLR